MFRYWVVLLLNCGFLECLILFYLYKKNIVFYYLIFEYGLNDIYLKLVFLKCKWIYCEGYNSI